MIDSKADPAIDIRGALIGYQNELITSANVDSRLALTPNTYERWIDNTAEMGTLYQLATLTEIDFIGVAAHNLFSAGVPSITIRYATTIGGALTDLVQIPVTSDGAILQLFDPVDAAEIQFFIADPGGIVPSREIGIIYAGKALRMERSIYGGHSPIDLSANTRYQSALSETGQFLGRTITRQGIETAYSWRYLSPDWYRANFQPFVESAKTLPFFLQWRPDLYPDAVAFGHTSADIQPSNVGGNGLMTVGFTMLGHADT